VVAVVVVVVVVVAVVVLCFDIVGTVTAMASSYKKSRSNNLQHFTLTELRLQCSVLDKMVVNKG